MVATNLEPALREAIKQNEIGGASPYALSYARFGASGASFGIFQGDTNTNGHARATLRTILTRRALPQELVTRVMNAVSQPCPGGNPLSPEDTKAVDEALSSADGRAEVDAMDDVLFAVVLEHLDACIAAAASRHCTIDPKALLYMALWINMSGPPNALRQWLSGAPIGELQPPAGPLISAAAIQIYLQHTAFFSAHPANLIHLQHSVQVGAEKLPTAAVAA